MHCDLLEPERRRRFRTAWCVGAGGAVLCLGAALLCMGGAPAAGGTSFPWLARLAAVLGATHALPAPPATAMPRLPAPQPSGERKPADADGDRNDALASSEPAATPKPVATVQTRPLSAWLADVAREAGRDLVLSPELHGDLTATTGGQLRWEQRLGAFARVFGFQFAVDEGLIEVRPPTRNRDDDARGGNESRSGSRQDHAAYPDESANQTAAARSGAGRGGGEAAAQAQRADPNTVPAVACKTEQPMETRIAPLVNAPAKELATVLAKAGDPLGVSVVPDLSSNAVVVSGTRASIARALALVRELDRPRRRVLLEAKIVELAHSARLDLGVEWKLAGDVGAEVNFPPPVSPVGSAAIVLATNGAHALDARIAAMEADGRVRVVSRPSVVMLEGSPATVESVRIMRIRLPSQGTVVGDEVVQGGGQRATEEIPVGVRLEVTPAVRAGGRVLLRIKAKSSSLGAPLPPDDIPEELSRMVDAELLVASGQTAVLGGLQRQSGQRNRAGVPVLREVPLLGTLFGRRSREEEAEELLVMVTPRVLD